jgi:hypothetical protein
MTAHYRVWDDEDPAAKRLVAFSMQAQAEFRKPNRCCFYEWDGAGKGLHSFTSELNLSNSRTRS